MDAASFFTKVRRLPAATRSLVEDHQERIDSLEIDLPDFKTVTAMRVLEGVCPAASAHVTVPLDVGKVPAYIGLPTVNGIPTLSMQVESLDAEKIVLKNVSAAEGAPFHLLVVWADD